MDQTRGAGDGAGPADGQARAAHDGRHQRGRPPPDRDVRHHGRRRADALLLPEPGLPGGGQGVPGEAAGQLAGPLSNRPQRQFGSAAAYTRTMAYTRSRPYAGTADLLRMQAAVARAYPVTSLRVGDLAWLTRYHTHRELSLDIRLWEDDAGQLVGWTYVRSFGGFNVFVAPGHADDALLDEMLAEIDVADRASVAAGDLPVSRYTYGIDLTRSVEDRALAAALERHGFTASPTIGGVLTRSLDEVLEPILPAGYRLGWVDTPAQVIGRVEAQQAAFAPSDLTIERYERVRRTWPYRPSLDRIVLTDGGVVVAFCTAWLDEENADRPVRAVRHAPDPSATRAGPGRLYRCAACTARGRSANRAGRLRERRGLCRYRALGFEFSAADGVYRRAPA